MFETNTTARAAPNNAVNAFARQPQFQCLSGSTIAELEHRNLLQVTPNGRWHIRDANNGCSRSFTNDKWKRCDTKGDGWHKLAGREDVVANDRKQVAFVLEGSKDALAVAEILNRLGLLTTTGIMAALGAGYRPIEAEIASLRGRKVVLVGDTDSAGRDCVKRVSDALTEHGVDHIVLCWHESAKDVFDLVQMHVAQKTDFASLFSSLTSFLSLPPLPSHCSATQPVLNPSTSTQQLKSSTQEMAELVEPCVVTAAGTGNTFSFRFARALMQRYGAALSDEVVRTALHLWFIRSRPLLPADADFDRTLRKFYGQLSRVRFTSAGLDAACERARNLPLPDVPGLSEPQLRAAALHRELQREAGDASYICPINVIKDFLKLIWPEQARWIQRQLEHAKVIQCVKRGVPNAPGFKGTSSLWRYLKDL